jgi:hypothetical protein
MIPTHQGDVIAIPQVMANQEPVEWQPVQGRIEQALDGSVTAPFAAPARESFHGHAATDGEHRLDHPTPLAKGRGLGTLASTSENNHNIGHGRRLLGCREEWAIQILHGIQPLCLIIRFGEGIDFR